MSAKIGSAARAASGPAMAHSSTYAAATEATFGSAPAATARPAITIENSPRAISVAPTRKALAPCNAASLAAHQPDNSFVRL